MKVIIASDHAGYKQKERLKKYLERRKIEYEDLGTDSLESVDYPDYAIKVAKKVAKNRKEDYRGILVCGTGTGMTIAANKVKGIRAVAAYDSYSARMSRIDNNTNVLGLRGRFFPYEKAKKIVSVWLNTPFSEKKRHRKRLKKISDYEEDR
ncbi:MAG: ribose 5-phosphate isomerase B [Candidatus Aminicenantes bacterium]|nr:MAG: ribose 5-phosphate isomerase B [Candidatus Aminicenantes bacterium]